MGGGNIELVCSQLDDIWEADDRTERGKKNNEEQHGDGILKSTNIEITAQKNEKSSRRCEMSMERALKRTQKNNSSPPLLSFLLCNLNETPLKTAKIFLPWYPRHHFSFYCTKEPYWRCNSLASFRDDISTTDFKKSTSNEHQPAVFE